MWDKLKNASKGITSTLGVESEWVSRDLKEAWKTITQRLKKRGLRPVNKSEWKIHDAHSGTEYMVFCGPAKVEGRKKETWVAIYPNRVYETNDWLNISSDRLIGIPAKGKRKKPQPPKPPGWDGERPRVKRISRDGSAGESSKIKSGT